MPGSREKTTSNGTESHKKTRKITVKIIEPPSHKPEAPIRKKKSIDPLSKIDTILKKKKPSTSVSDKPEKKNPKISKKTTTGSKDYFPMRSIKHLVSISGASSSNEAKKTLRTYLVRYGRELLKNANVIKGTTSTLNEEHLRRASEYIKGKP